MKLTFRNIKTLLVLPLLFIAWQSKSQSNETHITRSMLMAFMQHFEADSSTIHNDIVYKYYTNFRKDSACELGLRAIYANDFGKKTEYDYSIDTTFNGLSVKALINLLGHPDKIEMYKANGHTSISNSNISYKLSTKKSIEDNSFKTETEYLTFTVVNNYIHNRYSSYRGGTETRYDHIH